MLRNHIKEGVRNKEGRRKKVKKGSIFLPTNLTEALSLNQMGDCILNLEGIDGKRVILKAEGEDNAISIRWDPVRKVLDISSLGVNTLAIFPVVSNRVELVVRPFKKLFE